MGAGSSTGATLAASLASSSGSRVLISCIWRIRSPCAMTCRCSTRAALDCLRWPVSYSPAISSATSHAAPRASMEARRASSASAALACSACACRSASTCLACASACAAWSMATRCAACSFCPRLIRELVSLPMTPLAPPMAPPIAAPCTPALSQRLCRSSSEIGLPVTISSTVIPISSWSISGMPSAAMPSVPLAIPSSTRRPSGLRVRLPINLDWRTDGLMPVLMPMLRSTGPRPMSTPGTSSAP